MRHRDVQYTFTSDYYVTIVLEVTLKPSRPSWYPVTLTIRRPSRGFSRTKTRRTKRDTNVAWAIVKRHLIYGEWRVGGQDEPFIYDCVRVYSRLGIASRSLTRARERLRGFRPTDRLCLWSRADATRRVMRRIIYSCQLSADGQLPPIKMFRPESLTTTGERAGARVGVTKVFRRTLSCKKKRKKSDEWTYIAWFWYTTTEE